jgi:hypothetical protein
LTNGNQVKTIIHFSPLQLALCNLIEQALCFCLTAHLANVVYASVKLIAVLMEGVEGASSLVMLLQNKDPLARLCQDGCSAEATKTTANNNDIKVGWNLNE